MATHSCVICGEEASEQTPHIELPCWNHWVCKEDLVDFFVRATENESLYPPRCCDDVILLDQFEQYVPEDVQVAFLMKAQGEYQILQKYRVYCANSSCALFLSPTGHITDSKLNITYAICEGDNCGKATCVTCKALLVDGVESHTCAIREDDRKFKETVQEQGYQECFVCGRTVELVEACNHITCECGHNFCYICGKEWSGVHGCPPYGPAVYDEEGYNQDGFHRNTELNRHGRTRLQQGRRERGEESDDDNDSDEEDEHEDREENLPDWDVLQHLDADDRAIINFLPQNERQDVLEMIRIELMETRGITFNQPQHNHHEDDNGDDDVSNDGDSDDDRNEDDHDYDIRQDEVGQAEDQENSEDRDTEEQPEPEDHTEEVVTNISAFEVPLHSVVSSEADTEDANGGHATAKNDHNEHLIDELHRIDELYADNQPEYVETEEDLMDRSEAGSDTDIPVVPSVHNIAAYSAELDDA